MGSGARRWMGRLRRKWLSVGGKQRDKKAWFGSGRLVALNILEGRSFWGMLHSQYAIRAHQK